MASDKKYIEPTTTHFTSGFWAGWTKHHTPGHYWYTHPDGHRIRRISPRAQTGQYRWEAIAHGQPLQSESGRDRLFYSEHRARLAIERHLEVKANGRR